jgi:pimeloyl-ACP methyl ester carboxylesterase
MVSFNDFKLHIIDRGTGDPTVIIEGGLVCGVDTYETLIAPISEFTRIISYDHAGIGFSTRSPNPRTLPNYVKELWQLLDHEKIKPPYILVGHSMGGFIIRYFAHSYPDDLVGLVFIDYCPEGWVEYIRTTHSSEDVLKFDKFWDPYKSDFKGVEKEELEQWDLNCELIKGIGIPPEIPVRMLTSTKYQQWQQDQGWHPDDMKVWAEMQVSILEGLPDAKQIITDKSGHLMHYDEPELVVFSIEELVNKYRNSK